MLKRLHIEKKKKNRNQNHLKRRPSRQLTGSSFKNRPVYTDKIILDDGRHPRCIIL